MAKYTTTRTRVRQLETDLADTRQRLTALEGQVAELAEQVEVVDSYTNALGADLGVLIATVKPYGDHDQGRSDS